MIAAVLPLLAAKQRKTDGNDVRAKLLFLFMGALLELGAVSREEINACLLSWLRI